MITPGMSLGRLSGSSFKSSDEGKDDEASGGKRGRRLEGDGGEEAGKGVDGKAFNGKEKQDDDEANSLGNKRRRTQGLSKESLEVSRAGGAKNCLLSMHAGWIRECKMR